MKKTRTDCVGSILLGVLLSYLALSIQPWRMTYFLRFSFCVTGATSSRRDTQRLFQTLHHHKHLSQ